MWLRTEQQEFIFSTWALTVYCLSPRTPAVDRLFLAIPIIHLLSQLDEWISQCPSTSGYEFRMSFDHYCLMSVRCRASVVMMFRLVCDFPRLPEVLHDQRLPLYFHSYLVWLTKPFGNLNLLAVLKIVVIPAFGRLTGRMYWCKYSCKRSS